MALIGNIAIGMGVNLTPFNKGLAAAQTKVSAFAGSVVSLGSGLGAALGVGLGASALIGFGRSAMDSADAANDMAGQIGTTAGQLQELRYAAKLTGTETEVLDQGLLKLSQNLGDAARAGGPVSVALGKLGLNAKRLATEDPASAFLKVSTAISQIQNPALQASLAVDVFGKAGVKMLNTFRAGPEAIGKLTAEAKAFGLSLGDDQVQAIGAANDAIDRLTFAAQGLGTTLVTSVAPYLTQGVELLAGWTAELNTGEGQVGSWATAFKGAIESVMLVARNFGSIWTIAQLKITEAFGQILATLDVIPANLAIIAEYVGQNWKTLILDGLAAVGTGVRNLATNIANFATAIYSFLTDPTGGFEFDWTPLFEGFKADAAELPKLIKPALVDLSSEIADETSKIASNELKRIEETAIKSKQITAAKGPSSKGIEFDKSKDFAKTAELGSKEAYASIINHQLGNRDEPIKDVAKTAKQQLEVSKQQLQETKKLAAAGATVGVFKMA